jgi:hypothetical protein
LDQLEQKNPAAKSKLFEDINAVIAGLESMPFSELDEIKSGLQQGKISVLKCLYETLDKFLRSVGAVQ